VVDKVRVVTEKVTGWNQDLRLELYEGDELVDEMIDDDLGDYSVVFPEEVSDGLKGRLNLMNKLGDLPDGVPKEKLKQKFEGGQ